MANAEMRDERAQETPLETVLIRYYQQHGMRLRAAETIRYCLIRWSDFFKGALVSEVTPTRQEAFVVHMKDEGLSDAYIRMILAYGKAAINRAVRKGEILAAPFIDLSLAPDGEPRERILAKDEMAALLTAAEEPYLRLYMLLAIGTAARPEAILELTSFQCDTKRRLIRLNPPGRKQTKKRRPTIPMCDFLLSVLQRVPPGCLITYQNRPLKGIKAAFLRARDRAGLDRAVVPYTLRHTVASEMRARGVPVWEVAGFLGHTSGYKTTERYAKFGPDHLSDAVRALDTYFTDLKAAARYSWLSDHVSIAVRANCVLVGSPRLVEPDGIEPTTSTMPL